MIKSMLFAGLAMALMSGATLAADAHFGADRHLARGAYV